MRIRVLLLLAGGLLALPALPALADHTVTMVGVRFGVGEWAYADDLLRLGGVRGAITILDFTVDPLGVLEFNIPAPGLLGARCVRPGRVVWKIKYADGDGKQHNAILNVVCDERDTEK